ncbi:T-complex protein 11-like, partial [Cricetulus griseus]
ETSVTLPLRAYGPPLLAGYDGHVPLQPLQYWPFSSADLYNWKTNHPPFILVSLLLPRQNRLKNEIEEALDMDLLRQETEHGALDVPHLSNYILNLMALLCAPTLLMDKARLQNMKSKLRHLTILASVLLVARSFSCGVLFSSPEFVDKLKYITKALTEDFSSKPEESMLSVSDQVSQEIHQGLKDTGLTALSSENRASLVGQLRNIAKKENCIRTIIEQRIHLFLKCCLIRGMQESLLDFPGGLLFIEPELAELGWKFVNLMHHNQHVFSPYYAEILKRIISQTNGEESKEKPI